MTPILFLSLFLSLLSSVRATSTFSPARPPAQPLAVKSPYLSAWQAVGSDGGNGGYLAGQWPTFWAWVLIYHVLWGYLKRPNITYSGQNLGWTGLINVDGVTYGWMGAPPYVPMVNQTSYAYTSTSSVYVQSVENKVEITVMFLSPITPDDFQRQSLVFSYVKVKVKSLDGAEHDVQIYTDITAGKSIPLRRLVT